MFAAFPTESRAAVIHAVLRGSAVVVSADTAVSRFLDDGSGGMPGALGRWADGFASASLRPIPPVWCSWHQYYSDVTEANVLADLDAMEALDLVVGIVQIDDSYEAITTDGAPPQPPAPSSPARSPGRGPFPGANQASARPWRPHQRI